MAVELTPPGGALEMLADAAANTVVVPPPPCPVRGVLEASLWEVSREDICSETLVFQTWTKTLDRDVADTARKVRKGWLARKQNRGRAPRGKAAGKAPPAKPAVTVTAADKARKYVREVAWNAEVFTDTHYKVVYPNQENFLNGWPIDLVDAALEGARDIHEKKIPPWSEYCKTVKSLLNIS